MAIGSAAWDSFAEWIKESMGQSGASKLLVGSFFDGFYYGSLMVDMFMNLAGLFFVSDIW